MYANEDGRQLYRHERERGEDRGGVIPANFSSNVASRTSEPREFINAEVETMIYDISVSKITLSFLRKQILFAEKIAERERKKEGEKERER